MERIIKLSSRETRQYWEIPVLFEDAHLLAIEKPALLLTSPDRYDPERPNLMKLLHRDIARGSSWGREHQITYLANAHRLDFETSGILLLAKSKPIPVALANLFGSEKVKKSYIALVQGSPDENEFEVDAKLAPHPVKVHLMRVDPKRGKKSVTRFKVRECFSRHTLVQCFPQTGRTHQIRVHLAYRRLPIVGDSLYGGSPLLLSSLKRSFRLKANKVENPLIGRVALHAEGLEFTHPATNELVSIESAFPHDIAVGLKYLRRYAPRNVPPLYESPSSEESDEANADDDREQQEAKPGEMGESQQSL